MSRLVVVGGGPAGLATAIAARMHDLDVCVLDAATPPIDKACGEGLMPRGRRLLEDELGVQVDSDGVAPFRGLRFIDGDLVADAPFPMGEGLGVRRRHLHEAMVARAQAVGAELRWTTRVTGLVDGGVQTEQGAVLGDLVVGADGLHSQVRRWAGLDAVPGRYERFGLRKHVAVAPWSDRVEVWFRDDVQAYVTPAGPSRVGVALLWSGRKARFDTLLDAFPALRRRLGQAPDDSTVRGAGPLHQRVRAVITPGVALVGDASGYLDALTGEGLSLAFEQALALADATASGELARYAAAHRRIARVPMALAEAMLVAERRPWLRRRLVAALAARPDTFSQVLGVNDGSLAPSAIGLGRLLGLGWGMLLA